MLHNNNLDLFQRWGRVGLCLWIAFSVNLQLTEQSSKWSNGKIPANRRMFHKKKNQRESKTKDVRRQRKKMGQREKNEVKLLLYFSQF